MFGYILDMETIDEAVSVQFFSNHLKRSAGPVYLYWQGRRYTIQKVGLHHTVKEGNTLMHVYSVTDDTTFFKLSFNTENLQWKLLEIDS